MLADLSSLRFLRREPFLKPSQTEGVAQFEPMEGGEGQRQRVGRWNSAGVALVDASEHKSLAVLEILVHLDLQDAAHYLPDLPARMEFNYLLFCSPTATPVVASAHERADVGSANQGAVTGGTGAVQPVV